MILTLSTLAALALVHVAGAVWFSLERSRSTHQSDGMNPKIAATNMLEDAGLLPVVVVGHTNDTHFHIAKERVVLGDTLASRRDLQAVSIAMHECGHAVQLRRYGLEVMIFAAACPMLIFVTSFIGVCKVMNPAVAPAVIIALAMIRAGIEADAWLIANETLRKWHVGYSVPRRMIISSVLSYL